MRSIAFITVVVTSAFVAGHGRLKDPLPSFVNEFGDPSTFCATIDGPATWPGENYELDPRSNTEAFTRQFIKSGYPTLKAFLDDRPSGGECGITRLDGVPRDLPSDSTIKWSLGQEGFVSSHEGPCELWCDNTRLFHNDNCAKNYANGHIRIDKALCRGSKKLIVLWVALHAPQWQVYKNCVALRNSSPSVVPTPSVPVPTPSRTTHAPPSRFPSVTPTPSTTTPMPTHPNKNFARGWEQCGGRYYNGPTNCDLGFHCVGFKETYSQCMPNAPAEGELQTFDQCGGNGFSSKLVCKPGDHCVKLNDWFYQCTPIKSS